MPSAPTFHVVPGSTVKRVIDDNKKQVFDAVEAAYRLHGSGNALNPDSYFPVSYTHLTLPTIYSV